MSRFILIISLFLTSTCFGQDNGNSVYYSGNGVEIYIKPVDCKNPSKGTEIQYFVIEIQNTNSYNVKVSFDKEIWYDNVCQSCNSISDEYKTLVEVNSNSSIEGSCDDTNKNLRIFSKMLNLDKVRKLTKYELKNIKIENIK